MLQYLTLFCCRWCPCHFWLFNPVMSDLEYKRKKKRIQSIPIHHAFRVSCLLLGRQIFNYWHTRESCSRMSYRWDHVVCTLLCKASLRFIMFFPVILYYWIRIHLLVQKTQEIGLGRSLGVGNGNPLQYSCLKNSMDTGPWQATVRGVAKSTA